jgi:3-hydroxyacyl-CoA dehydrogenase
VAGFLDSVSAEMLSHFPSAGWSQKYPDEPAFKPVKTLDKLVAEGKLGVKSGEGFYKHTK